MILLRMCGFNKPTNAQIDFIKQIEEFSLFNPPLFTGKTKEDASIYISKYKDGLMDNWIIQNGYF